MNIEFVLGQASELVGVDADGDKAIELLKEWSEGDLPEKWTSYYKKKSPAEISLHRAFLELGQGTCPLVPP
ncbi:hypothetical protein [Mesobacillus stamsii]|uniref:Uncharacterized protein n=1 Tax=Mesobacillus stamsii TaxID=225347 RepID=A0ABU0FQI3_9BACI|nr:hypothetical protein [Mesobacillus stamsii]MDQ0412171.1 hypothetical protein [Mesobacillus stamsii]